MEFLLSGLIGALAVFFLGWLREWWRADRERRGLLRLLLAEIEHNAEVVKTIAESGQASLIGSPNLSLVKVRTWHNTQARAAQLVPGALFGDLDDYYSLLETLLTLRRFKGRTDEQGVRFLRSILAEHLGQEFVRSRDPWSWYSRRMMEAQDRTRDQVAAYLARDLPSWGDRITGAVAGWFERLPRNHPGGGRKR